MEILQINQDEYNELLFEAAYDYLDIVFPSNEWAKDKFTGYHKFWAWWKNEYYTLDEVILNQLKDSDVISESDSVGIRELYYDLHIHTEAKPEKHLYHYLFAEQDNEFKLRNTQKQEAL